MQEIKIIVGTETGTAEFVADDIKDTLEEQGLVAQVFLEHDEIIESLKQANTPQTWLLCTSTHGAGDYPNNLNTLVSAINEQEALPHIHFGVIGLGDSSYDTYCYAAKNLKELLIDKNAYQLFDPILADAMSDDLPEDIIIPKLIEVLDKIKGKLQ